MYFLIKNNDISTDKKYDLKNIYKKKTQIFNYFSFLSLFIFFLCYYLYYLSLEKCMSGQIICSKKINWIQKKITQAIFASIILGILTEFIVLDLITKLHLIHFFFLYYYL